MPRFTQPFLDDLRARVPVSEIVGRKVKLRREGAEWVGLSPFNAEKSPSFKVNDRKQFYHCFSSGKSGDVFTFLIDVEGMDFSAAVEEVAKIAGVPLPPDERRPGNSAVGNGSAASYRSEPPPVDGPEDYGAEAPAPGGGHAERRITATYPYQDAGEILRYEVCRMVFVEQGRQRKTFAQRRPVDGEPGFYAWGLAAGTYVRARSGDFYQLNDKRERWPGERREFDDVAHGLYMLPALLEERAQGGDARTVFLVEGEKDAHTAVDGLDLVATTNSGGARHWAPHLAEQFLDLDVVVVADNDKAGREGAHAKAASLRGIARRVRVLDWRDHWPGAPEKADLTDWVEKRRGTREDLFRILDRLPEWRPPRPESGFGAFTWGEIDSPGLQLEWLVKGLLVRRGTSVWYGPPGCGKSFLVNDCALAVARGVRWFGRRVRRGLVIYAAPEGGSGFKTRLRAYREARAIPADEEIPIIILPADINLFRGEDDAKKLADEVAAWGRYYDQPVELVVVDTLAAATTGWDENSGKDVGPVLARCKWISRQVGTHVALIHHSNAVGGKPRGHTSLTGNLDSVVEVMETDEVDFGEEAGGFKRQRKVKQFIARKVKDDESGWAETFVLKQVVLGVDSDGDRITSCIVSLTSDKAGKTIIDRSEVPPGFAVLPDNDRRIMRALKVALDKHGVISPAGVPCGEMTRCVRLMDWRDELFRLRDTGGDADEKRRLRDAVRRAVERACAGGRWVEQLRLIGREGDWAWRTSRKVHQVDEYVPPPPRKEKEAAPLLREGESEEDASTIG